MSDDPTKNTPPDPVPSDATVVWPTGSDPVPPTPPTDPASAAGGGLISATPVGWTGQDIGAGSAPPPPTSWGAPLTPASPPPPADSGAVPAGDQPTVHWAAPADSGRGVPGAPGLKFSDTATRFVAYLVDSFLIGIVAVIVGGAAGLGTTRTFATANSFYSNTSLTSTPFTVLSTALSLVYFVGLWSGGRRATLGQRLFGIQIGNAFDGRPLSLLQAIRRWVGLGSFLGLLALIPGFASGANGVEFIWVIVLLLSTILSPTKQGLHDKFANSAVVRPSGAGTSGCVWACVIVIGLLVVLSIVVIVGIALALPDFTRILSEIGNSI
jgi:uncharacterized RDD family membrane protein YckC